MDNSVPLSPNGADDSVTTGTPSPMKQNNNALMDALFKNLTRLFAFLVFILLAAILVSLVYGSRESLAKYGLSFLWLNDWDPVKQSYGAVVPIIGTLLTSAIALIIAVPVSFGIAIFLTELSPAWLRRRWAPRSRCWPRFPRSSTACGACSSSCRCSSNTCSPS